MSNVYKEQVGGSLKLKGINTTKSKRKKRSKLTSEPYAKKTESEVSIDGKIDVPTASEIESKKSKNQKTEAEKHFEEVQQRRQQDRILKQAKKSHKDNVAEFNQYLNNLVDHYDIPKVGPG